MVTSRYWDQADRRAADGARRVAPGANVIVLVAGIAIQFLLDCVACAVRLGLHLPSQMVGDAVGKRIITVRGRADLRQPAIAVHITPQTDPHRSAGLFVWVYGARHGRDRP